MEKQKKNNKIFLLISLGVIAAIVITLGITYAYWRLTREQTNENVVTTACLDVDIESQQDDINLPKAYPISDEDGANLVPFKFTIHNKCDDIAKYQINLESMSKNGEEDILEAQRLNPKYLKYKINEVGTSGKIGLLTGEKNNDTTKVTPTITAAYDAHILTTGYLKEGASKSYEFRIWMDSETTAEEIDSMTKTLVSKISVISTYATEAPVTLEETILGLETQEENSGTTGLYEVDHTGANIDYTIEAEKIQNLQKKEYRFAGKDPNNYVDVGDTYQSDVYVFNDTESSVIYGEYNSLEECENDNEEIEGTCEKIHSEGDTLYWRIIGLVNTPEGQRVKIIREASIGEYSWDTSAYEINGGFGINEWSKSDLMKLLNPNYDNYQENIFIDDENYEMRYVNNSLYWYGTSGNCYSSYENYVEVCDFTGKGIPEKLKGMIEEVTWNTGANADEAIIEGADEFDSYFNITPAKMYEYERSKNTGKQLCLSQGGGRNCNDEVERTYIWKGKVGLMYLSDYGYATSGGSEETRSKCLNQNLYFWSNSMFGSDAFPEETDHPDCYKNDWLLPLYYYDYDFTISITNFSYSSSNVFIIDSVDDGIGNYPNERAGRSGEIRPSVYLKSDVMVVDGNGSKDSPWLLELWA